MYHTPVSVTSEMNLQFAFIYSTSEMSGVDL